MKPTENLNVVEVLPIISPKELKKIIPLTSESLNTVEKARNEIKKILAAQDKRLLVIVGPCSIHDKKAGCKHLPR